MLYKNVIFICVINKKVLPLRRIVCNLVLRIVKGKKLLKK